LARCRQLLPIDGMPSGVASNSLSIVLLFVEWPHGSLIGSLHGLLALQPLRVRIINDPNHLLVPLRTHLSIAVRRYIS
jgi:hypothetical protein